MDPYIGEIRLFAGNYPPRDWAFCDGTLLAISQNTILFSIIGNRFGGNGTTNFALPNLGGSVPVGMGSGPGLSSHDLGTSGGSAAVQLSTQQMPAHSHAPNALADNGNNNQATSAVWAQYADTSTRPPTEALLYGDNSNLVQMNPSAVGVAGGGGAHNNMQPYLALNYIICLSGIFPNRP